MTKHLYSVPYRREDELHLNRVHRMTVIASSAEEARAYARIRDPRYSHTVKSPRRGAEVSFLLCRICHGPLDDDYTRLSDVDGFACWRCREKADLPEDQEFVTVDGGRHGDIAVEWVD